MWDDSDTEYFDGLTDGLIMFGGDNSPSGCLATVVVLIVVALILYYT